MQKITKIAFTEIDSIPKLIKDFLEGKISQFTEDNFTYGHIEERMAARAQFEPGKREVLFSVLKEQNAQLNLSSEQESNLNSLRNPNTFTVTTGHQLNLFTGPVFFIYKILQTVKMAEVLNHKYPQQRTIPIFWMASEDHDFAEIDHFKTDKQLYRIQAESGGAVGRIKVEDNHFVEEFAKEFQGLPFGEALIALLRRAYARGNTLGDATRLIVQELFGRYGLLVLDGDDRRLKREMHAVFKSELLHNDLFNHTKPAIEMLRRQYGKVQVNPRETNMFYLTETRNRLEFSGGRYHVVDTGVSFTREELLTELENFPERFSPNALLRPVYQEMILPNLAYIGGNAEIMYWLELKDYFRHLALAFPVLIPRNSLLFLTRKTLQKTDKVGLKIADFFTDFKKVIKAKLLQETDITVVLDETETALLENFAKLKQVAAKTDKTFGTLVSAEEARQLKSFVRMRKRLLRAEKLKHAEKVERLEDLYLKVHPAKTWQERVYNFSVFYAVLGEAWLQTCYEEMDVENSELLVFTI